eukprot:Polyplicarium_translucidae@DN1860_c0_g1_i1.p1
MESDEREAKRRRKTAEGQDTEKAVTRCPYLGTINRHLLDFDFEKLCSISLSNLNVYCCLVCGKYYQGRGKYTHAYSHSIEHEHYVFINLKDCRIYCLPENYEVADASLNDIKNYLNPRYTPDEVARFGNDVLYGKALDGTDFIGGCVGLNNLKHTDYCNVVVQILCNVIPLRNALLLLDLSSKQRPDPLLLTLSELVRKIFNVRNFKGIVSPHEFLQAVSVSSEKRFKIGESSDPLCFMSWLLTRLNARLHSRMKSTSVVHSCFQGEVLVQTIPGSDTHPAATPPAGTKHKFLYLTLEPPNSPIFKDSLDRNMIPTIPIFELLQKFDGATTTRDAQTGEMKTYWLLKLPPYLVFHVKRFSKNNFFVEKNPTIVTFPVKHLDMKDYLHPDAAADNPVARYNLVANVFHVGKAHAGQYKMHLFHQPSETWYELEDLHVNAVMPQEVAQSESYMQVFQREDVRANGTIEASPHSECV